MKLKMLKLKTSHGASVRCSHPLKSAKGGAASVIGDAHKQKVGQPADVGSNIIVVMKRDDQNAEPPSRKPYEPDFVVVRSRTPEEVVSLLLNRFPGVREIVASRDELYLAAPFHVYEILASDVRTKLDDPSFLQEVGKFIDDLVVEENDPLIGSVLVTSLLEGIAEDPEAAAQISAVIGERARALLRDVEIKIYGR
jgi:hypothetical protein